MDDAEGDATDAEAVAAAVAGQDAVQVDTRLEVDVARAVIAALTRSGVRRLLVTSGVGVGDSLANGTLGLRVLLETFLRGSTADEAAMERAVTASGLDWTIARPAILTDEPAKGSVRTSDPPPESRPAGFRASTWPRGWWPNWTTATTCAAQSPWRPAEFRRPGTRPDSRPRRDTPRENQGRRGA